MTALLRELPVRRRTALVRENLYWLIAWNALSSPAEIRTGRQMRSQIG